MFNKNLGLLCHISSLYSEYGVGDLGKPARDFIDFLQKDGYTRWEVLPLNKIDKSNCPYSSTALMAQEELYIDLEPFVERGVLTREEVDKLKNTSEPNKVDFYRVKGLKYHLLNKVYERLGNEAYQEGLEYMQQNPYCKDYAMYRVLSERYGTNDWSTWPHEVRFRHHEKMREIENECMGQMAKYGYLQKVFNTQYKAMKDYANSKNIKIVGDCAIYPDPKSVDVWVNQDMFKLGEDSRPYVNGGTPGQNWGTCMYRWEDRKQQVFDWWFKRIKHDMDLYDVLRIDHYTGLCWHYEIPKNGQPYWAPGGGMEFFDKLFTQIDKNRIVVEDLDSVSEDARQVRDKYNLKGMNVVLWAFDGNPENTSLPHKVNRNCMYYIGTHDHVPLRGFLNWADDNVINNMHKYFWLNHRASKDELAMRMLKSMMHSNADNVMLQLQDVLLQDENFMMNRVGQAEGQWTYMAPQDYKTRAIHPAHLKNMYYQKDDYALDEGR